VSGGWGAHLILLHAARISCHSSAGIRSFRGGSGEGVAHPILGGAKDGMSGAPYTRRAAHGILGVSHGIPGVSHRILAEAQDTQS